MQYQKIYAIHDNAAEAYLAPFFMANDLMAIRAFASLVNEKGHLFHDSPQDFTLFNVGTWDSINGTITADSSPRAIRGGLALVQKSNSEAQSDMFREELEKSGALDAPTMAINPDTGDLN